MVPSMAPAGKRSLSLTVKDTIGKDGFSRQGWCSKSKSSMNPLRPLSKPSWDGTVLQRSQPWNMHEGFWKRQGTSEGTKRSAVLPKSLPKGHCQGEHSPVRVEGHQVFIWTLTKCSIALVKLHGPEGRWEKRSSIDEAPAFTGKGRILSLMGKEQLYS